MPERKDEKLKKVLLELAAQYVQLESNRTSLITVTSIELFDHAKKATVFFTTLPVEKEEQVLDFLRRKRSDFQDYVKDNSRVGRVPFFDFKIDLGEKNRQRLDTISKV